MGDVHEFTGSELRANTPMQPTPLPVRSRSGVFEENFPDLSFVLSQGRG